MHLADELAMEAAAPEFPISHRLQAKPFLHRNHLAYALVLEGTQLVRGGCTLRHFCPQGKEAGWSQQAADVVGTKRGMGHGIFRNSGQ
jgi:hypothetical protein